MKCSIETFLLGLVTGVLTGMYAERYTRTTMRGRKIRREVNKTIRDIYGSAEQQIGKIKEKVSHSVDDARDVIDDALEAAK
ncbi:YtxH domain-containing protein [Barnesiella sp. WM24]|uniref:YtxH domain-containing protein n=1 Tax=Barnesiella sp. WM24 TaxID=2558278 RepID=UPI001071E792|nr:YtxH domain-containing protein [Barnesiella sp. WM24]MDE6114147.1 YtxH domain-containing protein [Muribaculum sp.]TFU93689.1 YtxH domain-containing protein [Barnesiella sp. WM24]